MLLMKVRRTCVSDAIVQTALCSELFLRRGGLEFVGSGDVILRKAIKINKVSICISPVMGLINFLAGGEGE